MKTMTGVSLGVLTILTLAACGGGGGGSASGGGSLLATAASTATPQPVSVSGTILSLDTGAPLVGATITIGAYAGTLPGKSAQPLAPLTTATTDVNGNFVATGPTTGLDMLQVSLVSYATLHTKISVGAGASAIGAYKITQLTADETAWLAQVNTDRVANGATGGIIIDEYAQEIARNYANDMAKGGFYADSYGTAYQATYSAMGGINGMGINLDAGQQNWQNAEAAFMVEKTCALPCQQGHYLTIIGKYNIWVGLGEALIGKPFGTYTGNMPYYVQSWIGGY